MIIFRTLKVVGFLSFRSPVTLSLEGQGVVSVRGENRDHGGSNGAGKTAIFEAIHWCLYGTLLRKGRARDVIHCQEDQCKVGLVLEANGREVAIQRVRGEAVSLVLYVDKENQTGSTMRATQASIDRWVMPSSVFQNTVMFGRSISRFMEATDEDRKTLVLGMLDLHFQPPHKLVRKRRVAISRELEVLEVQRGAMEAELEALEEEGRRGEEDLEQLRQAYLEQRGLLEEVIEQDEVQEETASARLEKRQRQAEQHKKDIEHWEQDGLVLKERIGNLRTLLRSTRQQVVQLQGIIQNDPPVCPTCHRPLREAMTEEARRAVEQDLEHQKEDEKRLLHDMLIKDEELQRQNEQLERMYSIFKNCREEQQLLSRGLLALQTSRVEAQATMDALQDPEDVMKASRGRREARERALRETLGGLDEEAAPIRERVQELTVWERGFHKDGCPALALQELGGELNLRAARYAEALSDGALQVRLEVVEDTLAVQAQLRGTAGSYNLLSEGWRSRADLAVFFACHDVSSRSNLLVVDEAIDVIDEEGVEQLLGVLAGRSGEAGSVFVISHRPDLQGRFQAMAGVAAKELVVQLEGGVSCLR